MSSLPLKPFAAAMVAFGLAAQSPRPAGHSQEPRPPVPLGQAQAGPRAAEGEVKAYDKVITSEFRTQDGLFRVHSSKGKYLLEIPRTELGKEMLLIASIKGSPSSVGFPGQSAGDLTVRWELRENKVLLRLCSHAALADPSTGLARSVQAMETATIMSAFAVEAFAKDGAPVIDVTRYFGGDISELGVKGAVQGSALDAGRSFIEKVKAFPDNLNVESLLTYNASPSPLPAGGPAGPPRARTAQVTYSMVRLPEVPMMPRLADDRIGFFGYEVLDFGREDQEALKRRFISRWRLEKKDPQAPRSEPVKPIIFYIDPATPAKWVPFLKRAVEAWQPAFEAAGFIHAIQAREAPKDDPDWSMDDARHSCIRWIPSAIGNARGPHVTDPRSGEILESKIEVYHNVIQRVTDWYFTQAAPLDARARRLPLPDDLMGELIAYVVSHEVGHTLGLPHNFKASSQYSLAQIRDKDWVRRNGHVSTLMDYCRFNYVAQPEDGIDVQDLIPRIGPYDLLAVQWGYTPVAGARTPDEEKPFLDSLLEVQKTTPWLRFSDPRSEGTDPGDQSEAVGDQDAVQATTLGLKNLKRVLDLVPSANAPGSLDKLEHSYQAVLGQWGQELAHVVPLVGGWDPAPVPGPGNRSRFTPVAQERQRKAVQFLIANLFRTPAWILPDAILRTLQPGSGQTELLGFQRNVLVNLLSAPRTARLQEHEAILGNRAYTVEKLLADLRGGILTELATGARVDGYRRNLQRVYVDILGSRLTTSSAPTTAMGGLGPVRLRFNANDDTRGAIRSELKAIQGLCGKGTDRTTRIHLADLKDQITRYLDPRPAAGPAGGSTR
ncbi:zinc-dependent metalloprotease [Geothrix sp. 21YS21S-2]|uniref:zinc-dependent metalloprotease n=1 Tax=Geothrix sp. 21YS21S-2 TaxID=3068893 RepID=UPI0027B8E94B|nr:zinc-dependent metalloprotease [Geothrix sp. 21YS21S-2]